MVSHEQIPAFCINLDRRSDRWSKVKDEFAKLNWDVTRVSAVEYHPGIKTRLKKGPAACMESHRKVWNMISQLDSEVAAVFEDDAVFPSDFLDIFPNAYSELPTDWKVWHLHSFGPGQMKRLALLGVYVTRLPNNGWGSHGYLIRKDFAIEAIRLSHEILNQPVDMFLTKGITDKGFSSYGVNPKFTLCFQFGGDTDIPETKQNAYWVKTRQMFCR